LEAKVEALRQQHAASLAELQAQVDAKAKFATQLEGEVVRLKKSARGSEDGDEVRRRLLERERDLEEKNRVVSILRQHYATQMQEREALRTIVEVKIKGLVDSVARQLNDVSMDSRTARDLSLLQRIVNASVNALK
jgi:ribose 1,5-bisphosphokinase PhnN